MIAELLPKQSQRRDYSCEALLTSDPDLRSVAHDDGRCHNRATHRLNGKCYCQRHAGVKALELMLNSPFKIIEPISLRITTPTKTLELIATSIEVLK